MDLELVIADEHDYEALQAVATDAFDDDARLYGMGPAIYEDKNRLKEILPNGNVRKILVDGEIVGLAIPQQKDPGVYRLGGIAIAPEAQNKGIGAAAMRKLESCYPDAKRWVLETPYLSFRNHHFYEKCGYRKVGETKPEKNGFVLFLYEKIV